MKVRITRYLTTADGDTILAGTTATVLGYHDSRESVPTIATPHDTAPGTIEDVQCRDGAIAVHTDGYVYPDRWWDQHGTTGQFNPTVSNGLVVGVNPEFLEVISV